MAFPRLQKLQNLQKEIILRGFDLLSDKGVMLYATCTYNPAENEEVVDFLLQRRDAVLHAVEAGIHHEPGVTEWEDESYNRQLARAARFYPHRVDSVGFFMAKIGKSP
jgi:16S rRNA C967 or C1407 C5-methylase (RsmB/RsmF family)